MQRNIILAGVGGQGILTIARAITHAALQRGLQIRQAEVHGMSQRGGAVQSHLRIADEELFSDLIPEGRADLILAIEPLEALRYVQYLRHGGAITSNTTAFVNINNYPPVEHLLAQIADLPGHILVDADAIAQRVGARRAANSVILGAAQPWLKLTCDELETALKELFSSKGEAVVATNLRAFRCGRNAALAYRAALQRGAGPRDVRHWLNAVSIEELEQSAPRFPGTPASAELLSPAEELSVEHVLRDICAEGREQLYEHEVYKLVELCGAISPPRYLFVPAGQSADEADLQAFRGEQVVLKVVSEKIVHKTEAQGVAFIPNDPQRINAEIARFAQRHRATAPIAGVLVVEYVERAEPGLGNELFVGIRATREFGPVIAAGLGGIDTEYLAEKLRPSIAVAKAVVSDTDADAFFELFQRTAAYDLMAGRARGHGRIVTDEELRRCFRAFLGIARRFCTPGSAQGPRLAELEVNPFAFREQRLIPLDGRARIGTMDALPLPRPLSRAQRLLTPRSIVVVGASANSVNFGRIILRNTIASGFDREALAAIHPTAREIDGVACYPRLSAVPDKIDLLVLATGGEQLPVLLGEVADNENVQSVIMISGGVGETEGSEQLERDVRSALARCRRRPDGGPAVIGPNSLGVLSRPGCYDTFFIPPEKLQYEQSRPPQPVAMISQSGAFMITRLSNWQTLNPRIAVSLGNQMDLTLGDLTTLISRRDDIDVIALYAEGFNNYDGATLMHAIRSATARGKDVIFYKAGRTGAGRSAAAGHTAAVAGDYDVCQAAAAHAGAIVVDTFKEFEQLVELAAAFHDKRIDGKRLAAMSNAGCETVAMADAIDGARYHIEMPMLSVEDRSRLADALRTHKLHQLVNLRNPLDVTPMAGDGAYIDAAAAMLAIESIDALIVSVVPLSPAICTMPDELDAPDGIAQRLPALAARSAKPLVFVVDSGPLYDPLAYRIRAAGVPTFRSCDQAVRSLGRYLSHRAALRRGGPVATDGSTPQTASNHATASQ